MLENRLPVVEIEDGRVLAESNAMLSYFAEGTAFLPDDRFERSQVLQWMFFEHYSHEPNIATSRFCLKHIGLDAAKRALLDHKRTAGYAALDVMEGHLGARGFLVGERFTIADIALYAYTHVADEGGFDLEGYPAVRAWLARIAAQPGHIPMTQR